MLVRKAAEALLDRLCLQYGFCLAPDARAALLADSPGDADAFTRAVYMYEGLNPELADLRQFREIRALVSEVFGQTEGYLDAGSK